MGLWLESFYKCVLILFRGASPTAKLNLIVLKYLRSFGTKTLGTKTLPVVTMHYGAYLKVIPICFDLNSRGFANAKLNLSLNIIKEMIYAIGGFWLILRQCIDSITTFQKAKTNRQFRKCPSVISGRLRRRIA